ncbi:sodium:solute symporter family transporter [Marinobacter sp. F4206]|uniref:sodium:solute symporter family transporter n=1 Tax=Marinobacter sp. F4206 TaxID=2861777 RepID=UPI001C5F968E|nr:sodium:solute symporter [Marinobacter sp. F4206]MBW4933558.1 sodium:solute symporter [Marinobacter sp. F4206]
MFYTTVAALTAALLIFTWLGLRARLADGSLDDYVTARNTQGARALGLSFLASGMGGWILFAPPEVGALVGPLALAGYAIGAALPFIVFAYCGPAIRRLLPEGRSIGEFAQACYGRGVRHHVSLISVLYMLCFLTAELTAIGAITSLLSGINGNLVVLGVALTTLIYTAWGGLRASIVTDQWQAFLLIGLLAIVGFVGLGQLPEVSTSRLPDVPATSALGVALTLIIAVTAANLFHQGYWQRLWSARDTGSLSRGAALGGLITVLVVAVVGGLGILASLSGADLGNPPIPFFALLGEAPAWLTLPALILAITLVASSVDTLQNALASLAVTEKRGLSITSARWITVALMVPVVLVALQGISVLRLFLIADLLCATAVLPVLMGLWSRMTTTAAIFGGLAGLLGAVLPGWIAGGSVMAGLEAASFPGSIPTLMPFVGALAGSGLVSLGIALARPAAGRT